MRPLFTLFVIFSGLTSPTATAAQQKSTAKKIDSAPSQSVLPARTAQLSSLEPDKGHESLLTRSFTFTAGGFFPYVDSGSKINNKSTGASGTAIDFESDLDLEEATATFFGEARWRITPHHRIEAEYFQLDRSGQTTVDVEIRFAELTAALGVDIDSVFDLKLGRISYGYSFFNDGEAEIGVMAGVHIADLNVGLTLPGSSVSETGEVTLPLPHIGVMGSYAFTPNLVAEARAVGFYLEIQSYQGLLFEADAKLTYMLSENFGLGAGLRYFHLDVEVDRSKYDGSVNLDYIGPSVFGVLSF